MIGKSKIHFLDTNEGGYMREYIDDVASKQGLDLKRKNEFDFAFNVAFKLLKIDCPDLNLPENIDSEEIKVMRKLLF